MLDVGSDRQNGFRVGAEHRLFHADLREWRKNRKLRQIDVSKMARMTLQRFGDIESFRAYPRQEEVAALEELTGIPSDRLFPSWLKEWTTGEPKTATTTHQITDAMLSEPVFKMLAAPDDTMESAVCSVDNDLLTGAVDTALSTLSERERRVVVARFGLDGEAPQTLEDATGAAGLGTRERTRQIEAKALRKLRHPTRTDTLRPFLQQCNGRSKPGLATPTFLEWVNRERMKGREDTVGALLNFVNGNECCRQHEPLALRAHINRDHHPIDGRFEPTMEQTISEYRDWIRRGKGD